MASLAGKSVLVTGGGSGIGLGCAARFAADDALVTICGRNEDRLKAAVATLGGDVAYVVADITNEEQIGGAIAAAASRGPLTAIVANAGGSTSIGPIGTLDADAWRATLELNATGTMFTIKHGSKALIEAGGGAIVAVSSIASSNTHRWFGAYGVSKAAVDHLVQLAADELGAFGVRVNGVRPGVVATELVAGIADQGPVLEDYLACMPIARIGQPEDIAEAVRFLAGPESAWVTGQILNVDGGHHLRRGPDYSSLFKDMFGAEALFGPTNPNR
ncbi:SDR family oxidoreductase [Actinocorallia sp. A-T 12471]|uniref:SDR family oxidoreductase n=1 Tax=Actinocorallia sp. A-T 12471 TaxID=3089813 RepID=UPI0029CDDF12|nr:SDR family oxidoreductase [Actinocorallia sp. A-T 12471]MDX6740999.1 SDR family oxidoreductase [Actinocorallia sp. A-T 12471]